MFLSNLLSNFIYTKFQTNIFKTRKNKNWKDLMKIDENSKMLFSSYFQNFILFKGTFKLFKFFF